MACQSLEKLGKHAKAQPIVLFHNFWVTPSVDRSFEGQKKHERCASGNDFSQSARKPGRLQENVLVFHLKDASSFT